MEAGLRGAEGDPDGLRDLAQRQADEVVQRDDGAMAGIERAKGLIDELTPRDRVPRGAA